MSDVARGEVVQLSLSAPDITELEISYVNQVLRTPQLSMGPMIERFEAGMADYVGTRHAVGVSSGTSGLHLCIKAAGISEGDRVITTPFSFVASANCILYERAVPVFVDIDPETKNIDPQKIEEKLNELEASGEGAKAILPVHVFGQPCDMDAIMSLADRFGLAVIEDACEAIGADYDNQRAGTFGLGAVFSFYPNKQMTLGEGGVVVTDDDEFAELCRSLVNQGRDRDKNWLRHVRLGYNYRLDEMSAALGVGQLERIEELLDKRQLVATWYNERLAEAAGVRVQFIAPKTTRMSWFVYVIQLHTSLDRDGIMADLASKGIPSRPYFTSIHLQPFYQADLGYRGGDFPITEAVASSTLALPFHGNITEVEVDYVCENLEQAIHLNP